MKYDRSQVKVRELTDDDLKAILAQYEAKHGMDSKSFIVKFRKGELEEHLDFIPWASYCEMLLREEYAKAHAKA